MKVNIELSDQALVTLSRWASLSRTFDMLTRVLENCDRAEAYDAIEILDEIRGPLQELHTSVRPQLWRNMCGHIVRTVRGRNGYVCRLPAGHSGEHKAV